MDRSSSPSSFESQLRRELHELGDHVPVRGRGPSAVRRTATRRRRRHQLAGVTVTVTLVGATTASVIATRDRGEQALVNAGSPAVSDVAPASAPPFDWRVLDEHSAVGDGPAVVTGADGTLYELSTAPGAQAPPADDGTYTPPPQALYSSTDGTTWTQHAVDQLWIGALAEQDGVLYAVGTAPSTAAVGGIAAVTARSTDGGATWTPTPLPLALGTDPSGVRTYLGQSVAATGPAGVVAAATTWSDVDVASLLPAGTLDDGYGTTADGVDVYGPVTDPAEIQQQACPPGWTASLVPATDAGSAVEANGQKAAVPVPVAVLDRQLAVGLRPSASGQIVSCASPDPGVEPLLAPVPAHVVAHHPWTELGVDPPAGARVGRSAVHLFVAADGRSFEEVAVPFASASDVQVLATADGYVALAQTFVGDGDAKGSQTLAAWRSTDGRTWTPIAAPALTDVSSVAGAGIVDGALVVVDGGGRILRSTDGGTWTATDLTAALGSSVPAGATVQVTVAGVGPAGVVASADVVTPPALQPITHDGVTLTIHGDTLTITDAATGAVLADGVAAYAPSADGTVRVDPVGGDIVVLDPATGAERARFGYEEIKRALVEQPWDPGAAVLITSTDGVHVGTTRVADLIGGASGFVSWIEVTDRALVDISRGGEGTGPADRVLLVGTPPR
jgi:hypothetical protein